MNIPIAPIDESLPRRERERLQHRQDITKAAIKVFADKGFFNATLDDIAKEAEFSKGALYNYFSSKEDMLFSILKEHVDFSFKYGRKLLDENIPFREAMTEVFVNFAEFSYDAPEFFDLFINLHNSGFKMLSDENRAELNGYHDRLHEMTVTRIEKAKADGELRDVPACAVEGIMHGSLDSLLITHWDMPSRDCIRSWVETFMDIIFNGIANREGEHR